MLLPTLTTNKRDVCHAQMAVSHAVLAMSAPSAAPNLTIIPQVSFVSKSVVMERDLHLPVMMETMLMAMAAQKIAVLKVDIIVSEDLLIQKILAHHLDLLL